MSDAENFLGRIPKLPPKQGKKPIKYPCSTTLETHTYEFIKGEADARNMTVAEFLRNICELLESGEF